MEGSLEGPGRHNLYGIYKILYSLATVSLNVIANSCLLRLASSELIKLLEGLQILLHEP
jgi:hypothetical protein